MVNIMFKNITLKKWKIISIFGIFVLSSLFHFIYDWFPCFLTSLLFPINESIWEHNKIIIGAFFIFSLLEKLYYKKEKDCLFNGFISAICCVFINTLIFSPIYFFILKTKDNIIITFIVYFISISISEYISYQLLKKDSNKKERLALILWLSIFLLNVILTYHPLNLPIFKDYSSTLI